MRTLALLATMLAATGCVPNVKPESYSIGAVGQVNRTIGGTIISARPVAIDGTRGGGGAAGGVAGAVAGSQIGRSDAAGAIGAVGGLVVGAIAGAAIERSASAHSGVEYVVETTNGNLMTVVQGG